MIHYNIDIVNYNLGIISPVTSYFLWDVTEKATKLVSVIYESIKNVKQGYTLFCLHFFIKMCKIGL